MADLPDAHDPDYKISHYNEIYVITTTDINHTATTITTNDITIYTYDCSHNLNIIQLLPHIKYL